MKALAPIVPKQVSAGIGNLRVVAFSGLNGGKHWVHMEILEGSYGGRHGLDGMDAVDTLYANTRNNPIEDMETHLPLRITRYELRDDAAAAGAWRGGIGSIREFEFLADGGFSIEGEGHKYRPWGYDGGSDGFTGRLVLQTGRHGTTEMVSKIPYYKVAAGDRLAAHGPSGGGYGAPQKRDPNAVCDDVRDGYLTAATAEADYGVCIVNGAVDPARTEALRRSKASSKV